MSKIYYKVITRANRCSAFIKNEKFRVFYPFNEWAIPMVKGSKLAAFSELHDAIKWMKGGDPNGLFLSCVPCEVRNPISIKGEGIPLVNFYRWKNIDDAWSMDQFWIHFSRYAKKFGSRKNLPKIADKLLRNKDVPAASVLKINSAVLCDAIKCLE